MITNSTIWIIFVVALGLPSSIMGLLLRRLEKKIEKSEEALEERTKTRVKHEIMLIEMSMASLTLAEATAEAVQRIPDAHCNGDMHEALQKAQETKEKYREFEREQTVKALHE